MNYAQFFVDEVSSKDRVLDVGCGRGTVAARVAEKAHDVLGVDLAVKNIEFARARYQRSNLHFEVADATASAFRGRHDTVVLSNVLEHIDRRVDFLKAMSHIAPRLLIRVPMINRDWVVLLKKQWGLPYLSDKTHFIEYTEETFAHEVAEAKLTISKTTIRFGEIWAVVVTGR